MTFCLNSVEYKLNEIVNKFLLVGDRFMPEMHLTQPGFIYSVCDPFTKNKEITDLDKACFQYMAYVKHKDLNKSTQSDKVLRDKVFEIANKTKYDGYQWGLASMVYKFFDKKSSGSGVMPNQQLANELHKPIIRKFKRRKVYSSFTDNIWVLI